MGKGMRGFTTGANCHPGRAGSNSPLQALRDPVSPILHEAEIRTVNTQSIQCLRGECAAASPFCSSHLSSSRLTIRYCPPAAALGSGILFSYPEISTIAGVQGLIVYTLSSSLPLLIFGFLGPIIRRQCPQGFVLTEWTRQRYGMVTALYFSLLT